MVKREEKLTWGPRNFSALHAQSSRGGQPRFTDTPALQAVCQCLPHPMWAPYSRHNQHYCRAQVKDQRAIIGPCHTATTAQRRLSSWHLNSKPALLLLGCAASPVTSVISGRIKTVPNLQMSKLRHRAIRRFPEIHTSPGIKNGGRKRQRGQLFDMIFIGPFSLLQK